MLTSIYHYGYICSVKQAKRYFFYCCDSKKKFIMRFTKMQGAGNDYVYINCFEEKIDDPHTLSKRISDRHFGVGSDGLVLIMPSDRCDFRMRMFNADGSEAQMCGNASRCVGKYVYDHGMTDKKEISLETKSGVKILKLFVEEGKVVRVRVDMGVPRFSPALIPVSIKGDAVINESIAVGGEEFRVTCVSMGNPHAVIFMPDIAGDDLHRIGAMIENHPLFPERTNVEFVQVVSPRELKMRVWERGAGETLACGTGACASLVAAVANGFADRKATLRLLGGDLEIEWDSISDHLFMTGPAETVFEGDFLYKSVVNE